MAGVRTETARAVKLDANGRMELNNRTLAEVWGIEMPKPPAPKPKPPPPKIPYAGKDRQERQFK
jgi:hypothetical protein